MTALPATDPDLAPIHYPASDGWRIANNALVSEAIRHIHAGQRISPINPTSTSPNGPTLPSPTPRRRHDSFLRPDRRPKPLYAAPPATL